MAKRTQRVGHVKSAGRSALMQSPLGVVTALSKSSFPLIVVVLQHMFP